MPSADASKSVARTASEIIAEQIRAEIATGKVRPGEMLPTETALLEQYDVARSTMREALRILESDGLITIERGTKGGARVQDPNIGSLARRFGLHLQLRGAKHRDLIEAQAAIQPVAARFAAAERTDADLARLRAAVAETASSENAGEFLAAVEAFASAILAASHNPVLGLVGELAEELGQQGLSAFTEEIHADEIYAGEFFRGEAARYGQLVDLIEARQADAAEAFWRSYMAETGAAHPFGPFPLHVYPSHQTAAAESPVRPPPH